MKYPSLILILFAFHFSASHAQLDNVVEVENSYKPVVKDANKINVLPDIEETTTKHYNVDYANTAIPSRYFVFQPAWAAPSDAQIEGAPRGFATIGGGNMGILNARAAYGFRFNPDNLLDVDVSLRGHNGKVEHYKHDDFDWKQRFYTTRASVGFEHKINHLSSLLVDGNFESQVFNYQPYYSPNDYYMVGVKPEAIQTDKQHNWLFDMSAAVTPYHFGNFSVGGKLGYSFFKQAYFSNKYDSNDKNQEVQFFGNIGLGYKIDEQNSFGLDLSARCMSYPIDEFDTNNSFTAVPHFDFSNDKINLHLGAIIYRSFGYQNKTRFAPDIHATYHLGENADVFASISGGEVVNDFRHFTQMSPYWALSGYYLQNGYMKGTQLANQFDTFRGTLGIILKPLDGLTAKLYGGYDVSKNRAELAYLVPMSISFNNGKYSNNVIAPIFTAKGSLIHFNAELRYDYKDILNVEAKGAFNGWGIDDDNPVYKDVMPWRPTLEFQAAAIYRLVKGLRFGVDIASQTYSHNDDIKYKRPHSFNLGSSLTYSMPLMSSKSNSRLSFYLRGDNLLNKKYDAYYGYRALGANFLLGTAVTF